MIITFVGSGGKTTSIFLLAEQLLKKQKTVLILTTTKIFTPLAFSKTGRSLPFYQESYFCLSGSPAEIHDHLQRDGICIAGLPSEKYPDTKITALSDSVYFQVCQYADYVLIEGDGSKSMPLKYPASHEPVIPANTDAVYVLYGASSIGKPLSQVTFRSELAIDCLNKSGQLSTLCTPNTLISPHMIEILYTNGYIFPLKKAFPHIPVILVPSPIEFTSSKIFPEY